MASSDAEVSCLTSCWKSWFSCHEEAATSSGRQPDHDAQDHRHHHPPEAPKLTEQHLRNKIERQEGESAGYKPWQSMEIAPRELPVDSANLTNRPSSTNNSSTYLPLRSFTELLSEVNTAFAHTIPYAVCDLSAMHIWGFSQRPMEKVTILIPISAQAMLRKCAKQQKWTQDPHQTSEFIVKSRKGERHALQVQFVEAQDWILLEAVPIHSRLPESSWTGMSTLGVKVLTLPTLLENAAKSWLTDFTSKKSSDAQLDHLHEDVMWLLKRLRSLQIHDEREYEHTPGVATLSKSNVPTAVTDLFAIPYFKRYGNPAIKAWELAGLTIPYWQAPDGKESRISFARANGGYGASPEVSPMTTPVEERKPVLIVYMPSGDGRDGDEGYSEAEKAEIAAVTGGQKRAVEVVNTASRVKTMQKTGRQLTTIQGWRDATRHGKRRDDSTKQGKKEVTNNRLTKPDHDFKKIDGKETTHKSRKYHEPNGYTGGELAAQARSEKDSHLQQVVPESQQQDRAKSAMAPRVREYAVDPIHGKSAISGKFGGLIREA